MVFVIVLNLTGPRDPVASLLRKAESVPE
jgi:hypothetical protein